MRKKFLLIILFVFLLLSVFFILYFSIQTDREYVRVEILNATKTRDLESKFAEKLKNKKCDVIRMDSVQCDSFLHTVVVERTRKNKANARIVANILGCRRIFMEIDSTMNVDVTVIIGEDFKKYIK